MMIQTLDPKQVDDAAMHPGLRVTRTINDTTDPRVHDRPGTHCTRLQGYEQFTARQAVVAQIARRIAQGCDFGMRGWVAFANRRIEASPDDDSITDHNGPHRNLTEAFSGARQRNRLAHEKFVVHRLSIAGSYCAGARPIG